MKAAIILLFLMFAWQGPSPYQGSHDNVKAHAKDDQGQTKNGTPVAGRASTNKDAEAARKQTEQSKEQPVKIVSAPKIFTESQKDSWDKALVISTCTLVVIGLLQIILLWRTVDATKDNAGAALSNARALINSERPWLLLDKNMFPDRNHTWLELVIRIHNFGRTPAKVTVMQVHVCFGDSQDTPPQTTIFDKIEPFNPHVLPQGEELTYEIDASHVQGANQYPSKHLWVSGLVRYEDTFGSANPTNHETLFSGHMMQHGGRTVWKRGPDQYNKAT